MRSLNATIDRLAARVLQPDTLWLFRKLTYGWLLLNALFFSPVVNLFYGEGAVIMRTVPKPGLLQNLSHILAMNRGYAEEIAVLYISAIVLSLTGLFGRIPRIAVFFLGWQFYYANIFAMNSGYILFLLFSFFLIFTGSTRARGISAILSNLALLAGKVQFLIVYALAGIYKLLGIMWVEGSALWYALHLEHFVPDRWSFLLEYPLLIRGLSIFGMVYQITFPALVWFRRIKGPLFILGLLFHSFIAIAMQLPDFALAMVFGYSLFFPETWSTAIRSRFQFRKGVK